MTELWIGNVAVPIDSAVAGDAGNSFVAQQMQPYHDGHMDWDGGGWAMMAMMSVFWIGVLVIAAWAVATAARHGGGVTQDTALDVARRRYARGEITSEEYERIRRDLQ